MRIKRRPYTCTGCPLMLLKAGGSPFNGKSGHSFPRFFGQKVAEAPLSKRIQWSASKVVDATKWSASWRSWNVVFNSMPSRSTENKVSNLCSFLFMKVTTGDITSPFLTWNCQTGIRKLTTPVDISSCAFMPWDGSKSDALGETALIITAAQKCNVSHGWSQVSLQKV